MIQDDTKDEGQGFTYDDLDRLTGVLEEEAIGEIGYINDTLTQTVRTIPFQRTYQNPVVFAQPLSRDGGDKSVVRITQVGSDSFSLYLDEAPNYDGAHGTEAVSYLVIEAGAWELSDGTRLEAGKIANIDFTVGFRRSGSWRTVTYANSFPAAPAVFSQVQTNGDASFVKTRQRNVTTTGFQMAMEEEENSTTSHGSETLGWLAIQVGGGRWSGKKYTAGQTSNAVTNSWYTINFGSDLGASLRFLASIGTYNNSDNCELRYNRLTASSTGVSIMVEEDTTYDAETTHPAEVVHYLAFGGDGLLGGHAAGAGPASPDYAWTYDEIGNMTSRSEGVSTVTYSYNDANHVHAVTGLSDGLSFVYDANGNMTSRDHEDTNYTQKFDVENRLVAITDTQTLSVTQFVYDGDGSRVKTIYPDGSWTAFIGEHYEVDDDYSTRSYYFLGSQRVAMRIQKDGQADQLYFFHTDHLGSTSLLSDENGQYVDGTEARYLPYGDYRVEPTADLTDYGFTGHKHNDSVGLVYMRARYYSPGLGRFLSADTIISEEGSPQALNRFSYVKNNPILYVDPSGHCIPDETCPDNKEEQKPGTDPIDEEWAKIFSVLGLADDIIVTAISSIGGSLEIVGFVIGTIDPSLAEELLSIAGYYKFFNPIENKLSAAGLGLNIISGALGGYNYYDSETKELVIGQDTMVNIATLVVGNNDILPLEGAGDTVVNVIQGVYDINRLREPTTLEPVIETRIGMDIEGGIYIDLVIYGSLAENLGMDPGSRIPLGSLY